MRATKASSLLLALALVAGAGCAQRNASTLPIPGVGTLEASFDTIGVPRVVQQELIYRDPETGSVIAGSYFCADSGSEGALEGTLGGVNAVAAIGITSMVSPIAGAITAVADLFKSAVTRGSRDIEQTPNTRCFGPSWGPGPPAGMFIVPPGTTDLQPPAAPELLPEEEPAFETSDDLEIRHEAAEVDAGDDIPRPPKRWRLEDYCAFLAENGSPPPPQCVP